MPNKQTPIPPGAFRNQWNFQNLGYGDDIFVPWSERRKARQAASQYRKSHPDFRWVSKKMPDPDNPGFFGIRIWRIEPPSGQKPAVRKTPK